jgi:hypothetical protein
MGALRYTWQNAVRGLLVFGAGDTAAALISGEFCWTRTVGIMAVGGTLYALEIPSFFAWIDRRVPEGGAFKNRLARATLALLWFNPLWIARHLLLIKLFAFEWQAIEPGLLAIGAWSFLINAPFSIVANYLIQNKAKRDLRFLWSAVYSAVLACYYALSDVLLR